MTLFGAGVLDISYFWHVFCWGRGQSMQIQCTALPSPKKTYEKLRTRNSESRFLIVRFETVFWISQNNPGYRSPSSLPPVPILVWCDGGCKNPGYVFPVLDIYDVKQLGTCFSIFFWPVVVVVAAAVVAVVAVVVFCDRTWRLVAPRLSSSMVTFRCDNL